MCGVTTQCRRYVLRAVPEATVSTPLKWNEVTPKLNRNAFNLKQFFEDWPTKKEDRLTRLIKSYRIYP